MHEFSLATEIVELARETALQAKKTTITELELEIGELSGVEEPALITALDSLMPNTILDNAKVKIKHTKGEAMCTECRMIFLLSDLFSLCPNCGGYAKKITSGKEFRLISVTAE